MTFLKRRAKGEHADTVCTTVRITAENHKRVQEYAYKERMTMSYCIETLLETALDIYEANEGTA